ncbi:hypothetical protein FKM82_014233 [Ascaphus truei]
MREGVTHARGCVYVCLYLAPLVTKAAAMCTAMWHGKVGIQIYRSELFQATWGWTKGPRQLHLDRDKRTSRCISGLLMKRSFTLHSIKL